MAVIRFMHDLNGQMSNLCAWPCNLTCKNKQNGTVDVERFRTYFLGLIEEHARDSNYREVVNDGAPSLPPLFGMRTTVEDSRDEAPG